MLLRRFASLVFLFSFYFIYQKVEMDDAPPTTTEEKEIEEEEECQVN
jgi:hypothetical protein